MNDRDDPDNVSLFRSYLELVRLPNIFTAMADVAMGFLFVQGVKWTLRPSDAGVMAILVAASSLLYAAGVVLNDVFDLERDRQERPTRPLPSGRISLRAARLLGWEMLLLGTVLPCGVAILLRQFQPAVVVGLLAVAIVFYNVGLKQTVAGPLAMGGCRMLNVLLGMSVAPRPLGPELWLVAAAVGVYITGVTWFARNEFERSDRRQLVAALAVMMTGVAMLAWLPRWAEGRPLLGLIDFDDRGALWQWYVLIGLLGAVVFFRSVWAIAVPVPGRVRIAVAQAIFSLVFLDAAACYAARGTYWAAVVLVLLIPAMLLGRWIEAT